VKNEQFDVARV